MKIYTNEIISFSDIENIMEKFKRVYIYGASTYAVYFFRSINDL